MANFSLKFIDSNFDYITVRAVKNGNKVDITISNEYEGGYETISLDKSTAIKLAKTIRTEINKITMEESEGNNG